MKIYIGKTLKSLRIRRNLSQQNAADLLCISRPTYKKLENDCSEIAQSKLFLIAEIYDLPIENLIKMIANENKANLKVDQNNEETRINQKIDDLKKDIHIIKMCVETILKSKFNI